MVTFYNLATLSYNNISTDSNIVTGAPTDLYYTVDPATGERCVVPGVAVLNVTETH